MPEVQQKLSRKEVLSLLIETIYDCIKAAGEAGIPSGHLYAMLLGKISYDTYDQIINALEVTRKITNTGHLLKVREPL